MELVREISTLAVTNIGRDMEDLAQAIQIEDWSQVRAEPPDERSSGQDGRSSREPGARQSQRDASATGRDLVADADSYAGLVVRSTGLI